MSLLMRRLIVRPPCAISRLEDVKKLTQLNRANPGADGLSYKLASVGTI